MDFHSLLEQEPSSHQITMDDFYKNAQITLLLRLRQMAPAKRMRFGNA